SRESALGCFELAAATWAGDGVARDDRRAVALFARACDLEDADACALAGFAVEAGAGVARDPARALALFQRAASHDDHLNVTDVVTAYVEKGPRESGVGCKAAPSCPEGCARECDAHLAEVRARFVAPIDRACDAGAPVACLASARMRAYGVYVEHVGRAVASD